MKAKTTISFTGESNPNVGRPADHAGLMDELARKMVAPTPFPRRVQSEDELAVLHYEKCAGCGATCTYREEKKSKHVVRLHLPEDWTHVHVYGGKQFQTTKTCVRRPMRQVRVPAVACPACRPTVTKDEYGYDVMDAPFLRAALRAAQEERP